MRRCFIIVSGVLSALLFPALASAQEFNHTITVHATVPEQRAIYLDEYGAVIKIAGNTTRNVAPKVYDSSNLEVPISPAIQQQYDDFLRQHGGKLQASKVYEVNPLKVVSSTNVQQVKVNLSGLTLGSGQNG